MSYEKLLMDVARHCDCRVCRIARDADNAPEWARKFARRVLRDAARQDREQDYQLQLEQRARPWWQRLREWFRS